MPFQNFVLIRDFITKNRMTLSIFPEYNPGGFSSNVNFE
jgi:hypothetical protein